MIAKVIVDIPSKSVDFKFDYLVPDHLKDFIKVGVRVVVPFGHVLFKDMLWIYNNNQVKMSI